jgi:epoxyqueuosine reductase
MHLKEHHTQLIKNYARKAGFDACGIAKAGFLEQEAISLEKWLKNGLNGKMAYMENHFDKRLNPTLLVDDAKSIISLTYNYYPTESLNPEQPKIAKYAYGEDYHQVIKDKLFEFLKFIQTEIGEVNGRVFVDSAPVMDKAWAKRSGLGWVGKNTNLIHPKRGSFFFIAELILDLELEPDNALKDFCGTCTRCIDACPTDALIQPYQIDARKCISYLTIELKDEILPSEFNGKMENWAFGCDICQDVCPWNRFSKPHSEKRFNPNQKLLSMSKNDWQDLSQELFTELFKHSAIQRTKFKGLQRNLDFLK